MRLLSTITIIFLLISCTKQTHQNVNDQSRYFSYSDQPKDSGLWTTERFVEEVEQVRKAIHADSSNFYVLGNSWGGILAMEYATYAEEV